MTETPSRCPICGGSGVLTGPGPMGTSVVCAVCRPEPPGWPASVGPRGAYPDDWATIARRVKDAAAWCCVRCQIPHQPAEGYCLTVHHLDGDKSNCAWFNLAALCQRCHLRIQGKVILARPWVWEHTDWFKPYVAGYYAQKYLGQTLDRSEVMARLDELLGLERAAVLGERR